MIGKPEDQRPNQRGQQQSRQQATRTEHFCQQRGKQSDKADNPNRINQQCAEDNRQRQRRQTRQGERQPKIAGYAVIQPHQRQRT